MQSVLIIEDDAETRRWLTGVVETAFSGCTVAGAGSVAAGAQAARAAAPDLAIIDIRLPDGDGMDALRVIKGLRAETVAVMMTALGDDAHIVAALAAGADGYLLKEQTSEEVRGHLQRLAAGIPALSPSVARRLMEHFRRTAPASEGAALTPREAEVLSLIGRGCRNADAAHELGVAESTIASHIKAIYRKLGISSRAEASWHAARLGLSPERFS